MAFCSEKGTAQLPGKYSEAALFVGLKGVIRRLPCAFSLIVDGAGQSKGTCQQEGTPQRKIAAVSGAGAGSALDKDYLDGVILCDILEGVGLHRAHALTVHQHLGHGVALVRGDGEGLIPSVTDGGPAGGRDGAVRAGRCLNGVVGVVGVVPTATGVGPVGVHSGVFIEYSSGRDFCAAACRGVPAVKAVSAAMGGGGQLGELLVNGSHAGNGGGAAIAIEVDGVPLPLVVIALHENLQRGKLPWHPLPHGGVIAHLNFQIVRGLAEIHDVGDARVGAVLRAVHRGDKGKGRLAGVVGIRHNGDTAGEDTVVLELGGIRAALHPNLHLLQAADILLRGIRRSLRVLAVTFHQNDNIRESAIQLPLVVDILQGEGLMGVALQPCIVMCFFGVRIVLVLVSGQIELDDGLQNTIFHVGRRVAQVKAAGDPPVCLAIAGCLALDGDKVCGNVEPRKIILCNGGDDGEGLEGCVLVIALAGDGHLAALLRRGVGIVAVGEVLILLQGRVAVLDLRRGMDRLPRIELRRDVGNHAGGQGLGRDLGSVVEGAVRYIVRVDKLDAYTQSARILDLWYAVAEAVSLIGGVALDAPAGGQISVIHDDRLVLFAVIFPFVGTCNSAKLALQLIRDVQMHRGNGEGCAVCAGLVGGSFLHTGDDGVFRAGLQVGEMAAALPGRPIVYGILPGTVFCYFNVSSRLGNQVEDRRGGTVRFLDGSHGCLNRAGLRAAAHLAGDFLVDVRLHQCIGLARADGVCLACAVPLVGQGAGVVGVGHIGGEGLAELRRTVDVHRAGKGGAGVVDLVDRQRAKLQLVNAVVIVARCHIDGHLVAARIGGRGGLPGIDRGGDALIVHGEVTDAIYTGFERNRGFLLVAVIVVGQSSHLEIRLIQIAAGDGKGPHMFLAGGIFAAGVVGYNIKVVGSGQLTFRDRSSALFILILKGEPTHGVSRITGRIFYRRNLCVSIVELAPYPAVHFLPVEYKGGHGFFRFHQRCLGGTGRHGVRGLHAGVDGVGGVFFQTGEHAAILPVLGRRGGAGGDCILLPVGHIGNLNFRVPTVCIVRYRSGSGRAGVVLLSHSGSGQQRQHHAAEQQDAEKSFSHGLVPPFSL